MAFSGGLNWLMLDEQGWRSAEPDLLLLVDDRENIFDRIVRKRLGVDWRQWRGLTVDPDRFNEIRIAAKAAVEDRRGDLWLAAGAKIYRYRADQRSPQTRMMHGPAATVGHWTSMLRFEWEGGDRESEPSELEYDCLLNLLPTPFRIYPF